MSIMKELSIEAEDELRDKIAEAYRLYWCLAQAIEG